MAGIGIRDLKSEIAISKKQIPILEGYVKENMSRGDRAGAKYYRDEIEKYKKRISEIESVIANKQKKK